MTRTIKTTIRITNKAQLQQILCSSSPFRFFSTCLTAKCSLICGKRSMFSRSKEVHLYFALKKKHTWNNVSSFGLPKSSMTLHVACSRPLFENSVLAPRPWFWSMLHHYSAERDARLKERTSLQDAHTPGQGIISVYLSPQELYWEAESRVMKES